MNFSHHYLGRIPSQTHKATARALFFAAASIMFAGECLGGYAIQIGAFAQPESLSRAVTLLERHGFPLMLETAEQKPVTRVMLGPYNDRSDALSALKQLSDTGYGGYIRRSRPDSTAPKAAGRRVSPGLESADLKPGQDNTAAPVRYAAAADPFADPFSAPETKDKPAVQSKSPLPFSINGYVQNETAYTFASPDHWSKFKNTVELALQKHFSSDLSMKVSGRFSYDGVYDFTTFFPGRVKRDQRWDGMFRETYLDVSAGNWNFRLGRQQIVWGEVIGLFFADVVSAKDLRELVIPELEYIRIPQWATRAEYFAGDFKAEAIWVPYMSYDRIGEPGSDFYPLTTPPPPGFQQVIRNERTPHKLEDAAFGLRASYLTSGWDLAGFYYNSIDSSPGFFRQVTLAPTPTITYRPGHDRIHQAGMTASKDLGVSVFRGEAVYTIGRWFTVDRLNDANGVVRQNFLDYILGLDFPLPMDSRVNVQFFQRWFPSHDDDIEPRKVESGASVFLSSKLFNEKVEPDLLLIHSLNRLDWLSRFRIAWRFADNWRFMVGTAVLGGKKSGLFGRFDNRDRVFTQLRYAF